MWFFALLKKTWAFQMRKGVIRTNLSTLWNLNNLIDLKQSIPLNNFSRGLLYLIHF
jgi:hypothetical protein